MKIPSPSSWKFLFKEWVKTLPCVSFYKVREGKEESKVKGQNACGQPQTNCFANATIPLSDLPKVLPCLHYKLDQLPEIGCMVVNGVSSLWPCSGIQEGNKGINWVSCLSHSWLHQWCGVHCCCRVHCRFRGWFPFLFHLINALEGRRFYLLRKDVLPTSLSCWKAAIGRIRRFYGDRAV